ncbi:hypothetical protein JCM19314_3105 [Nonlabens ulvanivorans]|uniref:Uncharacterized protein n=1 Tax=Nonlabens ulvanivorans TaxID=906888 RepID=A0A090Q7M4_NONUL|nr:hypothetical protein JCM19314_3105 [Nonlabens ulvanivorans]
MQILGAGDRVASKNFSRGIRRNNLLDGRFDYKKELRKNKYSNGPYFR